MRSEDSSECGDQMDLLRSESKVSTSTESTVVPGDLSDLESIVETEEEKEEEDDESTPPVCRCSSISSVLNASACESEDAQKVLPEGCIIFDWDDTLFPTWYMKFVVEPCLGKSSKRLPTDSLFYEPLKAHAGLVERVLRQARALGRVAIVTLSRSNWVLTSAAQYLPGLNLPELLEELEIPIYYAMEHVDSATARLARNDEAIVGLLRQGVDILSICKRTAMKKAVREVLGRRRGSDFHVLSIGDQEAERKAVKDLLWARSTGTSAHLCKTVKLLEDPKLQHLGHQLEVLAEWLPAMLAHHEDFDIDMEGEAMEGCDL